MQFWREANTVAQRATFFVAALTALTFLGAAAQAQSLGGDAHTRWSTGSAEPAFSAQQRFEFCDLARTMGSLVVAPQRIKDWVDTAFFAPVKSVEALTERVPSSSVRDDLQTWLRDARVEQHAAVRLLSGTPPSARPAGMSLWRVPVHVQAKAGQVSRPVGDDGLVEGGAARLERADFAAFLAQPDQRGGLDSLGRQMLAATLARVIRFNTQQREQCSGQPCELRVLVKSVAATATRDEPVLADVQLWAVSNRYAPVGEAGEQVLAGQRAVRLSVPNIAADGHELPNAADVYLSEQANRLVCVVPPSLRR
jgi:hypothetical protein